MLKTLLPITLCFFALFSCRTHDSAIGWDDNTPSNGGFQKVPFVEQETPAGMVLIEGGDYQFNYADGTDDLLHMHSYVISKYQETNGQYVVYLSFLKKFYSRATYEAALPDTNVWIARDASTLMGEYLVKNYLRSKEYEFYPVVGLTRDQILKYATWKTDRMNEYILVREGVLGDQSQITDSTQVFTTEGYYSGEFDEPETLLSPDDTTSLAKLSLRKVRMEDGILMPRYRLPTKQEWGFAQAAIGDSNYSYLKTPKGYSFEKYDKEGSYFYLNDVQKQQKKTSSLFPVHTGGLKNVTDSEPNNYQIHGMNQCLSEIVGDSTSSEIIGNSFHLLAIDRFATYNPENKNRYTIPSPFEEGQPIENQQAGLYGFRLAMRVYGNIDKKKRNKGK